MFYITGPRSFRPLGNLSASLKKAKVPKKLISVSSVTKANSLPMVQLSSIPTFDSAPCLVFMAKPRKLYIRVLYGAPLATL